LKKDEQVLATLRNFSEKRPAKEISKEEETVFNFLKAVLSVMALTPISADKKSMTTSAGAEVPAQIDVLDVGFSVLAEQVSLIDHDLFKGIAGHEFLRLNFNTAEKSPGFAGMVAKFNEWTSWVSTEVLARDRISARASVIVHFIKVAEKCRVLGNFHGCYAIIAGLNSSSVSRLKYTWEKVPQRVIEKFEDICALFDMSHNFKTYRETLHASHPPIVPYLGLYPKDLTSLEETPTYGTPTMVNFDKMRTLRKIVAQLREYQLRNYTFHAIPEMTSYLKHLKLQTNEQLFKLSLEREPRENKN